MGRITHEDLAQFIATGGRVGVPNGPQPDTTVEDIRIIGMRRRISQNMAIANAIPHITIVEEVDVSALEDLRGRLNAENTGAKLTMLPFLALAIVRAVRNQPHLNAHHLPDEELSRRFGAVNIGIATQTPRGLMVPVIRHAEARSLRDMATEIARLAEAARTGSALREDLSGSTITITSLGALGALATTPILNAPEVAIIGVNRMAVRPFWNGSAFEPRRMMNLSCSFDHRVIDGVAAASFTRRSASDASIARPKSGPLTASDSMPLAATASPGCCTFPRVSTCITGAVCGVTANALGYSFSFAATSSTRRCLRCRRCPGTGARAPS